MSRTQAVSRQTELKYYLLSPSAELSKIVFSQADEIGSMQQL